MKSGWVAGLGKLGFTGWKRRMDVVTSNSFEWETTKQLSVGQVLLAFALPSAFAFVGFRFVLPVIVERGTPPVVAWPMVASAMLLVLVGLAVFLLRSEAKELGIGLADRMCFKKLSAKQWAVYIGIMVAGFPLALLAGGLVEPLMRVTGLTVPEYFPFFLNPTIDPGQADPAVVSPGYPLKGKFVLIPLMGVTLLLNILAEELYFRAWMLPKLSRYGNFGWVMNGVLFAFYHTFQLWLLPMILAGSLIWAFVIYRSRSIWPAMVGHLVGNFLLTLLGMSLLILG